MKKRKSKNFPLSGFLSIMKGELRTFCKGELTLFVTKITLNFFEISLVLCLER